jgi:hypothetical protein
MLGSQGDDVNEYNLVSPWVLTGMTFVASYLVGQGETTPSGLDFKPDGTKMYVVGTFIDTVLEYTLSTPWSVATATYTQRFSVSAQETTPAALTFNSDGTRLYLLGATGDNITEYRLSSPYDISTAVFFTTGFTFTAETAPQGIYFNGTQNKAYIVGTTLRVVYELGTDAQLKYHGDSFTFDSQMFVGGRSEFFGEAYFNSTVRTNGSLIINGTISGAGTITSNNTFTLTRNLANVSSDGFISTNTTVATNLIPVQRSPRSRWSGTVWDTGAAASRTINWTAEAIPTSGNPASSRLAFSYDLNAGGYSEFVSFTSAGNVGIGTTNPSARLHSLGTTEQLRVGFDASNYLSTTVNSSGLVTLDAVGASAGFEFSDPVTATAQPALSALTDNHVLTKKILSDYTHFTRDLFRNVSTVVSGTGATIRRTTAISGVVDGDLNNTTTTAGSFCRQWVCSGSLEAHFDAASVISFNRPWTLFYKFYINLPTNTELLFGVGVDPTAGVPSSGTNIGVYFPNNTTVRLWRCNGGAAVTSSDGVVALPTAYAPSTWQYMWLECVGNGTINLYLQSALFTASPISKPSLPICTLSGVGTKASANGIINILRATGLPAAFTSLGLGDTRLIEI